MLSEVAHRDVKPESLLVVDRVSKRYEIYERPQDRLKQSLIPRLQTLLPIQLRRSRPFFKEFWALRDVSMTVDRGEAVGILGRNGAGKSTLLQIIAGTLAPTSGVVHVGGRIAALLELGSGFSPDFTGRENVRLSAALLGLTPDEIDLRFDDIAAFADIGEFLEQPVKTYSSGMMMRLAFAVQTAVEPELMIVDEALSVGDARLQKKCFSRLEQLRESGTTILFVTHDTGTILQFCTRAIVLDAGAIFSVGSPQLAAREYHRLLFEGVELPSSVSDLAERGSEQQVTESHSIMMSAKARDGIKLPEHPAKENTDKLVSAREVRYGSRDAEIFNIGLRDEAMRETRVVEAHNYCEFHFSVRFNVTIQNPVAYGFMISNPRGVEIFATMAAFYGKALPPSTAGSIFVCTLSSRMPLVPGVYFLSASIAHDDGRPSNEFLDYRFDAFEFQVIGTTRAFTTSIVDISGQLSHSKAENVVGNVSGAET